MTILLTIVAIYITMAGLMLWYSRREYKQNIERELKRQAAVANAIKRKHEALAEPIPFTNDLPSRPSLEGYSVKEE